MAETILITGARAPAALDLARCFAAAGFEVHMSDCAPSYMARFSRPVAKVHRYPSPRSDLSGFSSAIDTLITELRPRLVVPTCEEVFYLGALAQHAQRIFAPSIATLRNLHSKDSFIRSVQALNLPAPETTRLTSADDLLPLQGKSRDLVFKPEFSRFGAQTLIGPSPESVLALRPSPERAWVAQQRIVGEEVSFYAASVDSRLVAFSAYRSPWRFDGGAGYAFERLDPALHDRLLEIAAALAQALIPRGQFACDAIIDSAGAPWLLECNPRATSGVHLFDRRAALATALLEGAPTPVHALDAAPKHVGPALWTYGLAEAMAYDRWRAWRDRRRQSQDVISAPHDAAPIAGAIIDTMRLGLGAVARGKRLTDMATADIEWNGEAL